MAKTEQKDNSTYIQKKTLRKKALSILDSMGVEAKVMETHGGEGKLFDACYSHLETGIVFEKDERKAEKLAKQRPHWRVYQADSEKALADHVGADMPITLLDIDPYGACWNCVDGFFGSKRDFAPVLAICVNDGLRQTLSIKTGWKVEQMGEMVMRYGNDALYHHYLEICEELLGEKIAQAGYRLEQFNGYFCGFNSFMTHFLAIARRETSPFETTALQATEIPQA